MRLSQFAILTSTAVLVSQTGLAQAQASDWLFRCRMDLAEASKPESGKYTFQTRGKTAGAESRAAMDYSSGISARAAVYPTDAKDLLNPYSTLSLTLGLRDARRWQVVAPPWRCQLRRHRQGLPGDPRSTHHTQAHHRWQGLWPLPTQAGQLGHVFGMARAPLIPMGTASHPCCRLQTSQSSPLR